MSKTERIRKFFDRIAATNEKWLKRNWFYHEQLQSFYRSVIPKKQRIFEVGSSLGTLLQALHPQKGVGIDISTEMVKRARKKHPTLTFKQQNIENLQEKGVYDYVIMSDLIASLSDIQQALEKTATIMTDQSRLVVTSFNYLWEPILLLAEKLHLKMPVPLQNWLSNKDIESLFSLAGFEVIREGRFILFPLYIPIISTFFNKYVARLPLINHLCLVQYFIARKTPETGSNKAYTVSIIVPARNEAGNIEELTRRTPQLGIWTEVIFVEGGSRDQTRKEIKRIIKKYKNKNILLVNQGRGRGKGDAVRRGFVAAKGDILMILDADLSVDPEQMSKFYQAIRTGKGEMIMGSRLVYPLEKQSMRFLNVLGNKFFSVMFSWILGEPIKDTLCGTKVILKKDYEKIAANRKYFGNFDPFGDFDLIFGAAKLNLKILEIPVPYRARKYGTTNISRFRHGWLLLQMTIFALRKLKFT